MKDDERSLPAHISLLLQPDSYAHTVDNIQLIETHISWVVLTGNFAYKIKKPVNLGFLDFSTLAKRRFYCKEELRLNTRLAPTLYLDVLPISCLDNYVSFSPSSEIIDYAIKMVQFPQEMQLDRVLLAGRLQNEHIDALATLLAKFHQKTDVANKNDHFGEPEQIYTPLTENFILLHQLLSDNKTIRLLAPIESWSKSTFNLIESTLTQRKQAGFIRECHGDLHLRNLVLINEHPVAFDCIEFNPELRWIDTINDVAFLMMDLQDRQHYDFAQRFINAYFEKTGDYAAISLLRFYLVYRAMVRAKVDAIRASQMVIKSQQQKDANRACYGYLKLAYSYLQSSKPLLIITCGMSASGKSTLTQPLVEKLVAIRLRSDVERKRQFNITTQTSQSAVPNAGIYTPDATQHTYQYLAETAKLVLHANYPVIIDAACLKFEQRELLRQVATDNEVPFLIIHFTARDDTLRQRIKCRGKTVSDADLSILEYQLAHWQSLHQDELSNVITIDTESSNDLASLINKIKMYFKANRSP
ncbi:MAG: AAA family ATPase [Pseudomonadota bacterium]|nr:AAA family ATPase [Pseudomonadota bacterium]